MELFQIVGVAVTVLVLGGLLLRAQKAGGGINKSIDEVEQWLVSQGFAVAGKWPGSMMDSALHMSSSTDVEVGFFLGHRGIQRDQPDKKLLGKSDARLFRVWWLHTSVTLPEGQKFRAVIALRRRHDSTKVVWDYIKPNRWNVVPHSTGDAEFDALFEILVEQGLEDQELFDEDTRAAILGLRHDPYFDNLLLLVSPHRPDCLTLINPPLPSATNPSIDVIKTVARRLSEA